MLAAKKKLEKARDFFFQILTGYGMLNICT